MDYGLLGGLSKGAENFMQAYTGAKQSAQARALENQRMKLLMAEKGIAGFNESDEPIYTQQKQRELEAFDPQSPKSQRTKGLLKAEIQPLVERGLLGEDALSAIDQMSHNEIEKAGLLGKYASQPTSLYATDMRKTVSDNKLKKPLATAKPVVEKKEKPSIGETTIDKEFAKDYADYTVGGGFAQAKKGLAQIDQTIKELESNPQLVGSSLSFLPKTAREAIDPKSVAAQERVEDVVQRSMKAILGVFTEQEGKALIQRAFNPRLSAAENLDRLKKLKTSLEDMALAKQRASEYFEKNGTLRGFKGNTRFSVDDIINNIESPGSGATEQMDGRVTVTDGKKIYSIRREKLESAIEDGLKPVK